MWILLTLLVLCVVRYIAQSNAWKRANGEDEEEDDTE